MAKTKKLISDQVLYRLSGGVPDAAFPVDERDIWEAMAQIINSTLKLQQFSVNLPSGETIPENLMIATYENVATSSLPNGIGKSKAILPAMPISLPRNMGIYFIYEPNTPDSPFIPIQRGVTALLKTDALLNDILGQVSYEPKGNTVIFNKDLTLFGINYVTMELLVMDISQYGINDVLPIPADYEADLVERLIQQFSTVSPETGAVNNFTTAGQLPMQTPQRKV